MARKKNKELIEEAKLHQVDFSIKIKEKMVQNQSVLLEREVYQIPKEDDIRKRVEGVGVSTSVEEVDALLDRLISEKRTSADKIEIFKNQIRFHKIINKAKHLTMNGTLELEEIVLKLKPYLR